VSLSRHKKHGSASCRACTHSPARHAELLARGRGGAILPDEVDDVPRSGLHGGRRGEVEGARVAIDVVGEAEGVVGRLGGDEVDGEVGWGVGLEERTGISKGVSYSWSYACGLERGGRSR
jgi:hypothetical protein